MTYKKVLAMKPECVTLTMLEHMRLTCWVLLQGKALNFCM